MKILSLKIIDNNGKEIRNISFKKEGVSFVLGDVTKPKDNVKTSNSIGKTLLLKMIDYIYGANEDKKIIKKRIYGFQLLAVVEHENKKYNIKRVLGSSKNIFVNDETKSLEEYKKFFNINRELLSKQFYLTNKTSLISYLPNANSNDYITVLKLLNLENVSKLVEKISLLQDKLSEISNNKKQLIELLDIDKDKVSDEIFLNDKEVEELTSQVDELNKTISNLKISNENKIAQERYSKLNYELKQLRYEITDLETEKKDLNNYIADTNDFVMTNEDVVNIFEQTRIEVPEMVTKTLNDVNDFYSSIIETRISQAKKRLNIIIEELKEKGLKEKDIDYQLELLSNILSTNDAYKNAIEILYAHNNLLQDKKFKQGQLAQVENLRKKENSIETNLTSLFVELNELNDSIQTSIKQYKEFVFNLVKNIYDEDAKAVFHIDIKKYNPKNKPISIEMSITGDSGEGVNEVKKNIIDYLLYNFNKSLEIFVHDSSCYNGIDPRQVSGLIANLIEMTEKNKKQAIIAINKYQVSDDELLKYIEANASIILSEKDKLLRCNF